MSRTSSDVNFGTANAAVGASAATEAVAAGLTGASAFLREFPGLRRGDSGTNGGGGGNGRAGRGERVEKWKVAAVVGVVVAVAAAVVVGRARRG